MHLDASRSIASSILYRKFLKGPEVLKKEGIITVQLKKYAWQLFNKERCVLRISEIIITILVFICLLYENDIMKIHNKSPGLKPFYNLLKNNNNNKLM